MLKGIKRYVILCSVCLMVTGVLASDVRVVGLFDNAAVVEINGQRKMLKVGQSYQGVSLVSANSKIAIVEVDGQQQQLGLNREIRGGYSEPQLQTLSVARSDNGQYITAGSINSSPVKFLVDTGANTIAMNMQDAKRLGINFRMDGSRSQVTTAGGVVTSYHVVLDSVTVGTIEVNNVSAAVLEGDYPVHILLGMTYLKHVEMSEINGVMQLKQKY